MIYQIYKKYFFALVIALLIFCFLFCICLLWLFCLTLLFFQYNKQAKLLVCQYLESPKNLNAESLLKGFLGARLHQKKFKKSNLTFCKED